MHELIFWGVFEEKKIFFVKNMLVLDKEGPDR